MPSWGDFFWMNFSQRICRLNFCFVANNFCSQFVVALFSCLDASLFYFTMIDMEKIESPKSFFLKAGEANVWKRCGTIFFNERTNKYCTRKELDTRFVSQWWDDCFFLKIFFSSISCSLFMISFEARKPFFSVRGFLWVVGEGRGLVATCVLGTDEQLLRCKSGKENLHATQFFLSTLKLDTGKYIQTSFSFQYLRWYR